MPEDIINIEILEDGTIKSTTPKISAANHSNSAEFFKFLARLAAGATTVTRRGKAAHTHTHDHVTGGN